jgi:Pin2-interacting protein X1
LLTGNSKRKLGNDPNNTKWSRNTDSFGQKILRAQGWQPGQYLGAKDASHAEWHTEANLAHIKVTLKDDNLGLGAKRNHGDECTGLDAFQDLLGRLNGKSDEALETERKAREDLKLNLYVERKLGTIRFVRGGWLVGDQLKETADEVVAESQGNVVSERSSDAAGLVTGRSRKRRADESPDLIDEKAQNVEKKTKMRKTKPVSEDAAQEKDKPKPTKRGVESPSHGDEVAASSVSTGSKRKKDKKKANADPAQTTSAADSEAGDIPDVANDKAEKVKKKQKKDKKKEKREKKEKKDKKSKKKKAPPSPETDDSEDTAKDTVISEEGTTTAPTGAESTTISTPSGSGYSTPVPTGSSRYLARSRFIAQKRMAFTDTAALNQVRLTFQCTM